MQVRSYRDPRAPEQVVQTKNPFLSDAVYAEVVQKMPIPCTDVAFTIAGDRALYLAHRNIYPQPHIWVIGGRFFFNDETPAHAIARCVKREAGLDIALERFQFVFAAYYSWTRVTQGEHGGKNLSLTFACEITPEEKERISSSLVASEYLPGFGLQRFDRKRLVDEKCHPVLLDLFDALYPAA